MEGCYAYPPFTKVPTMVLRWSMVNKGFEQTPPDDLDEFAIGKSISMNLRKSGHMCVVLRPEFGRGRNGGLQKVTIECPATGQVLDTYHFKRGIEGYERISKEWKRYRVFYPTIEGRCV
uniref:Uncharacterized protein n=1 Tax=Clytia hemisphaerica TaxID=252671 RepID=A0A7M5WQ92_9CNID|eukprot:TCONS_00062135-protein